MTSLALSVRQPMLELILRGRKTVEVRSRSTRVRERVLLYAPMTVHEHPAYSIAEVDALPCGVVVGSVAIVGCRPLALSDARSAGCARFDAIAGLYAWLLEAPERWREKEWFHPMEHPQPGLWRCSTPEEWIAAGYEIEVR